MRRFIRWKLWDSIVVWRGVSAEETVSQPFLECSRICCVLSLTVERCRWLSVMVLTDVRCRFMVCTSVFFGYVSGKDVI